MLEQTIYHKDSDKIMIIKPNTLIEAGFDLTEAEHDLMTLAINKLHRLQSGGKRVLISAKEFANANRVNEIYAYRVLRETAKVLGERKLKFTLYMDKNLPATRVVNQLTVIKPTHSNFTTLRSEYNWLQGVSYQDQMGFIILDFSDPLAFVIENAEKSYTRYDFIKTVDFKGSSSKRLYELVNKWKGLGEIPLMSVDKWKELFGVTGKYPQITEFKRRVLDPAITQINAQGEFELTLQTTRYGRSINQIGITIKMHKNKPESAKKIPLATARLLTPTQADKFAKKLANDSDFGGKFASTGEDMYPFIARLSQELQRDLAKVELYLPYLTKAGFK